MPIKKLEKINNNSLWCFWEITESVDQLRRNIILSEDGENELKKISHPIKQSERLAARCCVKELVQHLGKPYEGILKDEHDKPHLIGLNYHISISHSYPFAAAIIHKMLPTGIDIEKPTEKIGRIAHRFLNDAEFADCDGNFKKLCIYWAGKESIFKLNGKTGLNFKEDISIAPFNLLKKDVIKSEFRLGNETARIALNYQEFMDYIVCFCF